MDAPTLLITGATGFLGGATLAHIVQVRPDCRVIALVRATSMEEGAQRIARSLARFEVVASRPVEILCGDITDLATFDDARLDDVTHAVHLAANTSFRSIRSVRHVNILGTMTLAHRMRRVRKLQRFLHVGTAFSCGVMASGTIVREDDYPRSDARHVVEYARSKAEAEMLLQNTARELPLVIARPSVVVGHSRLGCAPSASIFWFFRTADLLRRSAVPMDVRDDIVPVDYAAAALEALLFKPRLAHRRYHVSAGAGGCTWREMSAAFDRHYGTRPADPYRIVDAETLALERNRMVSRLGTGDEERMLMALRLYYGFPTLTFDNERLLAEGIPPPPRFVDYLDVCMTRPGGRSVYEQMTDDD